LIAELETRVEQLKASEIDMKNLFYREKEAHEVLEYDYKQLAYECDKHMELRIVLTVQNRAQVHHKTTGDLVPFSPRRVLPRFVNLRIERKPLRFSI
jgi:hypothetical protein